MLNERLIAVTTPKADEGNFVFWQDYRVTVLTDRLFRIEKNDKRKFRDEATQAVWYRNTAKQDFKIDADDAHAVIETSACRLILYKERRQVCVEIDGTRRTLDNYGNLLGTYRTLDRCDGDTFYPNPHSGQAPYKIQLGKGVCSKTGVAVLDDSNSYTLGADGQVKPEKAAGSDEYVFVYGDDYRTALRALYMITGRTPLVPRFALGNWWSRYHVYNEEEYLRLLNRFEDRKVPISVATVDMDWHYSVNVDEEMAVSASGRNLPDFIGERCGNLGWTGYTWNKYLFPDPKRFMDDLHARGMKVTLNLHPSDGFRYWEDCYANMANAMGMDEFEQKQIPFDFSYDRFINAYFALAHNPHEEMGVDFWWIDWQQAEIEWHDERSYLEKAQDPIPFAYDPLWALNHYHYYDQAGKKAMPLILSRYAGVGSHRYPIGFSGDTAISWKTLAYLPYFTATATNVGYTWWSHDIGGHDFGEKSNELFLRHLQYGVFSPINRLHCTRDDIMTKEPWAYGLASGIAEEFLRFRHKLVPYLYTASYLNCVEGTALIEPLYYEWKDKGAYSFKEEYRFGSELIVAPVTQKAYPDGYARVRAWIPQGKWTDIFTGEEYEAGEGGREFLLLRDMSSIPVLAKWGAILPLSMDNQNAAKNPEKMEIWAFEGTGAYTMYEDGLDEQNSAAMYTGFASQLMQTEAEYIQSLVISAQGDASVCPKNRTMKVCFKSVREGVARLFVDGEEVPCKTRLSDRLSVEFDFDPTKTYQIEVTYPQTTRLEKWFVRAQQILTEAEGMNVQKSAFWQQLSAVQSEMEYIQLVDSAPLEMVVKQRLKEFI